MKTETLNFEEIKKKAEIRKETSILKRWLKVRNYEFCPYNIKIDYENVENYSIKVYTMRYCGRLVFRKFLNGESIRYEINI